MKPKALENARIDAVNNASGSINRYFRQLEGLESVGFNVDVITDIHPQLAKDPLARHTEPLRDVWQMLATPSKPNEYTAFIRFQGSLAVGGSLIGGSYAAQRAMRRLRVFQGLTPDRLSFEYDQDGAVVRAAYPSVVFDRRHNEPEAGDYPVRLFSTARHAGAYAVGFDESALPFRAARGYDLKYMIQQMSSELSDKEIYDTLADRAVEYFSIQ